MKRKTPLKRAGRIKPKKRSAAEFARIYHSKARVAFVKSLGCAVCFRTGDCDNAHTESGGKARKADYTTIVPLCRRHHIQYDQHIPPFDDLGQRAQIRAYAEWVQAAWLRSPQNGRFA